jgi:hypothetical protein
MAVSNKVRYLGYVWHGLMGLVYLVIVIGVLSVANSRFETLVLAGLIQLYAAVLYNSSVIGAAADVNNYAGFARFRILAAAQGITENEDGTLQEQEEALANLLKSSKAPIFIRRLAGSAVSIYALFKIVEAAFFS